MRGEVRRSSKKHHYNHYTNTAVILNREHGSGPGRLSPNTGDYPVNLLHLRIRRWWIQQRRIQQ